MSTEYTVASGVGENDWFINKDLYEKDVLFLYTKCAEPAMISGEFVVELTPDVIEAIRELI